MGGSVHDWQEHSHAPEAFCLIVPLGHVGGEEHGCPTLSHDPAVGVAKTSSGDFGIGSDLVMTGLAATKRFSENASVTAMATIARRKRSAFTRLDLIGGLVHWLASDRRAPQRTQHPRPPQGERLHKPILLST